ncbi:MAG: SLBB domain-containing protein [Candidatus Cloacimonetes bacterium]|nr:SLBB domain-containing protein [Candidatus Cloacimonadota bacterium]
MKNNLIVLMLIALSVLTTTVCSALPISVNVVGYVRQPGVLVMDNNNRISDAVFMANRLPDQQFLPESDTDLYSGKTLEDIKSEQQEKLTMELEDKPDSKVYSKTLLDQQVISFDNLPSKLSLRRLVLIRNGEERTLDLMQYFRLGDTSQNPYLMDGDVIKVPCKLEDVYLNGSWNQNQKLELVKGDRLSTITRLGLGLQPEADPSRIFVYRFSSDYQERITIPVDLKKALSEPGSEADILLQNGDEIYAYSRPFYNGKEFVTIEGMIKYPGQYPVNNGELGLLELLNSSGGPSIRGDLNLAYIVDPDMTLQEDPDYLRLKEMSKKDMSFAEYGYFLIRLRQMTGKYSVDFKQLWETQDSSYDVKIKPGAYVYIPEKLDKVIVSGQVKNPGLYEYIEGLTWKEWIEKAGGKLNQSKISHSRIVDARTGQWRKPKKDDVLMPGDMVFVPQAKDRSLWEDTQAVIAFTSQMITIFLGVTSLLAN